MWLLLDENLPLAGSTFCPEKENGELIELAQREFGLLVTMDQGSHTS